MKTQFSACLKPSANLLFVLLLCTKLVHAQSLPTDAQTLTDAKAAIKTATVQKTEFTSDWKQERESGYTFANLAKKAIKMQVKDITTGKERRFEGLAIYQRGAPTDKWKFSRFFTYTNSIEMVGQAADTALLNKLTMDAMNARPSDWFGEVNSVYWVHPYTIEPGSFKQSSDRQMSWIITYNVTQRWDYTYLVKRWYKKEVKAYLLQDSNTWMLNPGNDGEKELNRKEMNPAQLDKMPNVSKKGFFAIYGNPPEWAK